jgi:hypothetical protein
MRRRGGWLGLGVVGGIACWITPATAWLAAGVGVALLATRQRRWLVTPWPWLGGAVALAIAAPHLAWQASHGWPAWSALTGGSTDAGRFALAQLTALHPLGALVALAGWGFLALAIVSTPYRALAWPVVVVAVLLAVTGGAPAALAAAFPALFAAGGLGVDRHVSRRGRPWMRPVALVALGVGGLATAPLALPLLPAGARAEFRSAYGRVLPLPGDGAAAAASRSPSSASTDGRR